MHSKQMTTVLAAMGFAFMGWAQTPSIPTLQDLARTPRTPFLVQGCHAECTDQLPQASERGFLPANNYDMGPSIARSDSFDVHHYELFLDLTSYSQQSMEALAVIDFQVLQGGGTRVWWDLSDLAVDSVLWNGAAVPFHQWGDELHVDALGGDQRHGTTPEIPLHQRGGNGDGDAVA